MNTKFYTCTLLPEVTRDDPPKLGVRCNETGVRAAFWREEDRALFLAAPDLLEALEAIAPKDGPELARSESGGYECPHCAGFWNDWTSTFAHHDDCTFVKARKAIAKTTNKAT